MFTIFMLLACSEKDTALTTETGTSEPTFENEEHLVLSPEMEQCGNYWRAGAGNMIEGAFLQMSSPAYPYEIRGVSIQAIISDDYCLNSEGTIHLIAYVGDDPRNSEEIVSFMQYDTLAPYSFPELENVVSTTIALDGSSNPETLENDRYEFLATFDEPLLVDNDQQFWVGFGIHDLDDICINACDTTNSVVLVNQGVFIEQPTVPNFGVVLGY